MSDHKETSFQRSSFQKNRFFAFLGKNAILSGIQFIYFAIEKPRKTGFQIDLHFQPRSLWETVLEKQIFWNDKFLLPARAFT